MSKQTRPKWCTKPKPCDFDDASDYCPHRECMDKRDKIEELASAGVDCRKLTRSVRDSTNRNAADRMIKRRTGKGLTASGFADDSSRFLDAAKPHPGRGRTP